MNALVGIVRSLPTPRRRDILAETLRHDSGPQGPIPMKKKIQEKNL